MGGNIFKLKVLNIIIIYTSFLVSGLFVDVMVLSFLMSELRAVSGV